MTASWVAALAAHERDGTAAVLVTIVRARGSAPRGAGTKMVVNATGQSGTIGGGALEHACTEAARTLLDAGGNEPVLREFPLGPALGQCCGGQVSVLLEPVLPPAWTIAVFGAGHVGAALVALLGALPCRVLWRDERPGVFPPAPPGNVRAGAGGIETVPPGAAVLVLTHDHQRDFELTAAALAREDLPFVGLIGSDTKRARFVSRLTRVGLAPAAIARLTCPIGVPGAGGKLPAEIAIAVAAQLLQRRGSAVVATPRPMLVHDNARAGCAGCKDVAR